MERLSDRIICNPTVKLKNGDTYAYIDMEKIVVGTKNTNDYEYKKYEGQGCSKFSNGDTIMARITPCLENGKIAQCKTDSSNAFGSTEFFVFREKENISDNDYIFYLISSKYIRELAINSMSGASGRQRADIKFISRIKWDFPDIKKQKKIGKILSSYDELIERNNRKIEILQEQVQEIYKEWFVRFRFPGHETAEFENGLPKGWCFIRIGDITKLLSGYAFKSEWFVENGVCVAKIKDVGNIIMDTNDFSCVDETNCIKAQKFILNEGDLTIALTGATIGKISIVPKYIKKIYTNQRLGKFFNGDNPIDNLPYLYCLFSQEFIKQEIINISNSSSAQQNIAPEQIENIKFFSSKNIISSFNKATKHFFKLILEYSYINSNLIKQRDFLLPRLMSGKLEV